MKYEDFKNDAGFAITKAGLSSIPIFGAAASEVFSLLVMPPVEQRREKWMLEIGEKLKKLEDSHIINIEKLRENPIFIDVVIQTTQSALKTSTQEKILYYQNILLNSAVNENPDETELRIFLNLIESFTLWHIKILQLFNNPKEWLEVNKIEKPNYFAASLASVVELAFPELKGRNDLYELIWDNLYSSRLHDSGSLGGIVSENALWDSRTTLLGKRFLSFIKDNKI
jgi:hypothetical protein